MSKRKDALREMLLPVSQEAPPDKEQGSVRKPAQSGSLKAMGLSLTSLSHDAQDAERLRQMLAEGENIVDLDPAVVEPSFIQDRMSLVETVDDDLLASIREHGQQVPILVRPKPNATGVYQAAYGHRRLAAARALGKPVKAIVRNLSNEQLVVAQGKENLERQDLSFIERARFATRLENYGFSRATVIAALGLHKGNLSTMLSITRGIEDDLLVAIGPAPKTGRPRWDQLFRALKSTGNRWRELIVSPSFVKLPSDERFNWLLRELAPKNESSAQQFTDPSGRLRISVIEGRGSTKVIFDHRLDPQFRTYLGKKLTGLLVEFEKLKTS